MIVLARIAGLSRAEIDERMGRSETSVRSLFHQRAGIARWRSWRTTCVLRTKTRPEHTDGAQQFLRSA